MRFSIIIPVYNSACFLTKTLDSVCEQSYSNFEVICVNDGSTDGSLNILNIYKSKYPFITIVSQNNQGPSAARNKGLSIAQGEYILFCDSDDWFVRNTVLTELDAYIRQQKQIIDAVYFPGNTNWGGNTIPASGFQEKLYQSGWELLSDYCLKSKGSCLFIGSIYAIVYRLDIIRQYSLSFDSDVSYSEDRLFVFDFLDKAKFSVTYPVPCYFYNVRNDSLMTINNVKRKKIEDELKVAEIMIKRDWVHKKTHSIKKYISKFYFACIQNLWNINNYPQVKYKFELIYTISSFRKFLKVVIVLVSPKLYKRLIKQ